MPHALTSLLVLARRQRQVRHHVASVATFIAVAVLSVPAVAQQGPVSFARQVVPLLTRHGCNTAACHGARQPLPLSLYGGDARADYDQIVKQVAGRYIDLVVPQRSLLCLKATGAVAHKGSRIADASHEMLRRWIAQGAPGPQDDGVRLVRLEVSPAGIVLPAGQSIEPMVRAHWSDGNTTDVTQLVTFHGDDEDTIAIRMDHRAGDYRMIAKSEGRTLLRVRYLDRVAAVPVTVVPKPAGQGDAASDNLSIDKSPPTFAPHTFVDRLIQQEWQRIDLQPSGPASDGRFLSRAYVHLIGQLPSPRDVRLFVGSSDKEKRTKLIDQLLASAEFTGHWGEVWGEWLLGDASLPNDALARAADRWLQGAITENRPLDRLIREMLLAEGDAAKNGAAAFFAAYSTPERAAGEFSLRVLGASLACAQCHAHPSESYAPADFAALASCFASLVLHQEGKEKFVVQRDPRRRLKHPATGEDITPGIWGTPLAAGAGDPRAPLADWLAGEGQLVLARSLVNRYWRHLFGAGLVEPDGDLRSSTEALFPDVLEALAKDLVDHRFDARHLLRVICLSKVYELASEAIPGHRREAERQYLARFPVHRIPQGLVTALLDQVMETKDTSRALAGKPADTPRWHAMARTDSPLSRPPRRDCPRAGATDTLSSSLHLLGGSNVQQAISNPRNRIGRLLASGYSDERITEELFLAVLARRPKQDERAALERHFQSTTTGKTSLRAARRTYFEDILWALINSKEFLFVH